MTRLGAGWPAGGQVRRAGSGAVDLTISLLRPDDLLALVVEATNMRLDTSDPASPRLVRDTAGQPALLTFRFPPQSIAERAYFEVPRRRVTPPPFNPPPSNPPLPPLPPPPAHRAARAARARRRPDERREPPGVPGARQPGRHPVHGRRAARLEPADPGAAAGRLRAARRQPGGGPRPARDRRARAAARPRSSCRTGCMLAPNVSPQATPAWLHADHARRPRRPHRALAHPPRLAGRQPRRRARRGVGGEPAAGAGGLVAGLRRRRPAAAPHDRQRARSGPRPRRPTGTRSSSSAPASPATRSPRRTWSSTPTSPSR